MSINKSISFLIVSALLILPGIIAKASDVDVQTTSSRVTVGKDGSISIIKSKSPGVVVIPNHRVPNSVYRHQHWPIRNRTSNYNTWIKKITQCSSSYSHQSTQTSASGRRVGKTNTSTSTTVCR